MFYSKASAQASTSGKSIGYLTLRNRFEVIGKKEGEEKEADEDNEVE